MACRCEGSPSRRQLLTAAAAALIGVAAAPAGARSFRWTSGCYIAPHDFDELVLGNLPPDEQPWDPTSGTIIGASRQGPAFDRALGRVLVRMTEIFDVSPGFGFYDDSAGMNALAAPVTRVNGTSGTVVFGLNMLDDQMRRNGDIAIAAICAHEFGHIYQYATGDFERVRRRMPRYCTELQADFMAGYFLRIFAQDPRRRISLEGVEDAWSSLGSSDFNRPGTHGTNEQRALAIKEGYFFSDGGGTIDEAAAAGFDHVSQYA